MPQIQDKVVEKKVKRIKGCLAGRGTKDEIKFIRGIGLHRDGIAVTYERTPICPACGSSKLAKNGRTPAQVCKDLSALTGLTRVATGSSSPDLITRSTR